MLNVVLQRAVFENEDDADAKLIIDVCRDALKSMADIVKYDSDDGNTILHAVALLCGTCDGVSRFCNIGADGDDQTDAKLEVCQTKVDLSDCVYGTVMNVIVPYVKEADLSRVDPIEFHRSLVSCLNNLYRQRNCNHDDLSNHLAANGYLKYFLCLTVRLPDLRWNVCALLSRILSVLGKIAFCKDTITFANTLRQGLLQLPRDSKQWNDAVAYHGEAGTALMISLYYHFLGTRENDMISLESLIVKILSLQKFTTSVRRQSSVQTLKPLWFLFAVTSLSHPQPHLISNYTDAVTLLTTTLQRFELSEFYTHHIDLLHYCLKCPDISQNFVNRVLDLWLIESDGDIKPLLPFNHDKVIVLQADYSENLINLAAKALRQVIQTYKADKRQIDEIAEIVWYMLPNILLDYHSNTVAHIEAVLELANIIQPHTIPIHLITRSIDIIISIILNKDADSKFMVLMVTQAHILLVAAAERKSFKVLEMYMQSTLLKKLYAYGFAEEISQLRTISIQLLAFIIYCQKETSIKCKQPLIVSVKDLAKLLMSTKMSPCCSISGMKLVLELLTQNADESAIVLEKIDVNMLINLYEILHIVHMQKDPTQKDLVYQCLVALLHFCNAKVTRLLLHLCTVMSNYDLVSNVVNMRFVSRHFVEFAVTWLRYRKATFKDVPWNARSLFKSPFDEALDHLKEYSTLVNDKGLKDAYLSLQSTVSTVAGNPEI
ncbi:hypothetical protein X777_14352 [Ooceraea biroi]|uniref:Uncharacterized protein n=1 Tax=Ooceraea biroi TaxID=2015173 RepID=A0A026WUQ6_OOCBI|nr:hypothetical protein X777_14352 [Ooceraea biroi]